ncbi:hypothetical protein DRA42_00810 [Ethanoligenens harbinense]|nr:hypothetical protein CXQ68_00795 [Ethanoligenens harbinense YUAN-3]AYF37606.1 hypothetical protein CXP51_00800 [Ethanoligenens harbinense]AYF40326.1 hypothetical protein CN246_00795 [Ethanoligenens harbinense]QCN91162.1 hypothetical protein DRA42_00810 [Ethanoligenens harbinense]
MSIKRAVPAAVPASLTGCGGVHIISYNSAPIRGKHGGRPLSGGSGAFGRGPLFGHVSRVAGCNHVNQQGHAVYQLRANQ